MAIAIQEHAFPPIWVLNLKESIERKIYISQHLKDFNLNFQLIEAVDGNRLSAEERQSFYSSEEAIKLSGRELSPGEIGCSLSHLKVYEKMIQEKVEEAIILEDDAEINPSFLEIMKERAFFPLDWELILFCHHRKRDSTYISYWRRKKIHNEYKIVKFNAEPWGTLGYMIKKSAAKKLIKHGYPVRMTADALTGGLVKTFVILYGIAPNCIFPSKIIGQKYPTIPLKSDYQKELRKQWDKYERRFWYRSKRKFVSIYKQLNPRYII